MNKETIKEVFDELAQEYSELSETDCYHWITCERDHEDNVRDTNDFIQRLRDRLNKALK